MQWCSTADQRSGKQETTGCPDLDADSVRSPLAGSSERGRLLFHDVDSALPERHIRRAERAALDGAHNVLSSEDAAARCCTRSLSGDSLPFPPTCFAKLT